MSIGFWQIAVVVILVVLLFGRGKISGLMGDVAKGIKSFKKGMSTDISDEASTDAKIPDEVSTEAKEDPDQKNISNDNSDVEQK
tara:strand:+ start:738 stop:989 length:252 start_codon:yes stop_codon:yes gene_type:complete